MEPLQDIKQSLGAKISELLEHLHAVENDAPAAFFTQIAVNLAAVQIEEDLLELFMLLSTTAFQGFALDPKAAVLVDVVLLHAEQIAQTFTADPTSAH